MSPAHRRYLLLDQGIGSVVVNLAVNAGIAWGLFRGLATVPLSGDPSIMGDTIATSVLLPFITTLIVTPITRRHVRAGRLPPLGAEAASRPPLAWLPGNVVLRGLLVGAVALIVLVPLTWALFVALGVSGLGLRAFIVFKAVWAAFAGILVTPLLALRAIADVPAPATLVTRDSAA